MADMHDNPQPDTAPVPGERVRRLLGWHGYDWMKAAVALIMAGLLLYGNAAGMSDGQPATATPTSGMAVAGGTQAAPSAASTTAAPTVQNDAPASATIMATPGEATLPATTQAATAASTAATTASTSAPTFPAATTTVTGTATGQPPADVIVVIDVSASMAADNKIAGVQAALASFAGMLDANDRVELITFSSTAAIRLPMEPVADARATMKEIAQGLTPGGATTLYDTTLLAFREMQASGDPAHHRVIIVLTDGRDERLNANNVSVPGSTATLDEALAGIQRGGQDGIRLFTIGYGANADNDVLQRMAAAANGRHFVAGPTTIQEVYQTIVQSL
jgi:Mg-chelatase subunit ChlD